MENREQFIKKLVDFENEHIIPVIIHKQKDKKVDWIYSSSFVETVKRSFLNRFSRKEERVNVLKKVLDLYSENKISTSMVHVAFIIMFQEFSADSLGVREIGQKRLGIFERIPEIIIYPDNEFLTWQIKNIL